MNLVFPGTFNPFHYGHLDIVKRAQTLLGDGDHLFIGISVNPEKSKHQLIPDNVNTINHMLAIEKLSKVIVKYYTSSTVDFCKSNNAKLVRGLRNSADFEYEKPMATVNKEFGIETIFLMTDSKYSHISSSLIRNMLHANLSVASYMPSVIISYITTQGNS
jgi:pantetheine-phosphate adenylyltransferase